MHKLCTNYAKVIFFFKPPLKKKVRINFDKNRSGITNLLKKMTPKAPCKTGSFHFYLSKTTNLCINFS